MEKQGEEVQAQVQKHFEDLADRLNGLVALINYYKIFIFTEKSAVWVC